MVRKGVFMMSLPASVLRVVAVTDAVRAVDVAGVRASAEPLKIVGR